MVFDILKDVMTMNFCIYTVFLPLAITVMMSAHFSFVDVRRVQNEPSLRSITLFFHRRLRTNRQDPWYAKPASRSPKKSVRRSWKDIGSATQNFLNVSLVSLFSSWILPKPGGQTKLAVIMGRKCDNQASLDCEKAMLTLSLVVIVFIFLFCTRVFTSSNKVTSFRHVFLFGIAACSLVFPLAFHFLFRIAS